MTLLIDADWLVFTSCINAEREYEWMRDLWSFKFDAQEVHEIIDTRIERYQAIAEGDKDVVMCFTEYPTFRHTIYPEFKANR